MKRDLFLEIFFIFLHSHSGGVLTVELSVVKAVSGVQTQQAYGPLIACKSKHGEQEMNRSALKTDK